MLVHPLTFFIIYCFQHGLHEVIGYALVLVAVKMPIVSYLDERCALSHLKR